MKKMIPALDPRTKMTLTVFYAVFVVAIRDAPADQRRVGASGTSIKK
ncbi:MAG: hypothetical protein JRH18_20245 [Deltaproteobacteria bacterium]|nr:hypothetical protein [Deltaproteobacteria bacterium]MBW2153982.1 hypothetical protein [Deltaproteobacteria bacterium]